MTRLLSIDENSSLNHTVTVLLIFLLRQKENASFAHVKALFDIMLSMLSRGKNGYQNVGSSML